MRIRLPITAQDALIKLARRERRDPRDEAAVLIIRALQRRGLLPKGEIATEPRRDVAPPEPPARPVIVTRAPGGDRGN